MRRFPLVEKALLYSSTLSWLTLRPSPFWHVAQFRFVVCCRRFGQCVGIHAQSQSFTKVVCSSFSFLVMSHRHHCFSDQLWNIKPLLDHRGKPAAACTQMTTTSPGFLWTDSTCGRIHITRFP